MSSRIVFLLIACIFYVSADLPPTCDSKIYCYGSMLHTIQMAEPFKDSKTFVDMKLKNDPESTHNKFEKFMKKHNDKPSKGDVVNFIRNNFEEVGQEFEDWEPEDWTENPTFIKNVKDSALRKWMSFLNKIWKQLGRKIKSDVKTHSDLYSLIWVPNPVVVPGGRFREFYYWDSYWIIKGLLLSEMDKTAKGMLENFLYMVDKFGKVPNGGRRYYEGRSQPPLLIPSIKLYYEHTGDKQFISSKLDIMEKEYQFWIDTHTKEVTIKNRKYTVPHYGDTTGGPRPESYREDVKTASNLDSDTKKEALYSELKAAAESGWDFSSRWFIKDRRNKGTLKDIKTRSIIPVDLSSLLCWNARILSELYGATGNAAKQDEFINKADEWLQTVEAVHWHEDAGVWLDYDLENTMRRYFFYASNFHPLWTGCYNMSKKMEIVQNVLRYIKDNHAVQMAGVPTSMYMTGEQWDYPNAWPPLQHILIVGLNNTGIKEAKKLALKIAKRWIYANYIAYVITGDMYEKYDSSSFGLAGKGGEYEVQLGFGWTNGVIMDLINRYASGAIRVKSCCMLPAILFIINFNNKIF